MSYIKLPYGKKDDELYHVDVVDSGLKCECVCPKCGGLLIAAKGPQNVAHFRHVDVRECEGATEFAIREKLMQLFEKAGQIKLPESRAEIQGKSRVLVEEEVVEIESVSAVPSENPFMPRFVVRTRSKNENEQSITAIVNLGADDVRIEEIDEPVVEIRLSELGDDYSVERLVRAVITDTQCFRWGSRPRAKEREAEIREELTIIHTTGPDAERLLNIAKKPEPSELLRGRSYPSEDYFASSSTEAKYEPSSPDTSQFSVQFAGIEFTCEECGKSGLSHDDMQRFKPSLGTGVCYDCKGNRRANAHLNNNYV